MNINRNTFDVAAQIATEKEKYEKEKQEVADIIVHQLELGKEAKYNCTDGSPYRNTTFTFADNTKFSPNEMQFRDIAQEFVKAEYYVYELDLSNSAGRWRTFLFRRWPLPSTDRRFSNKSIIKSF